MYASFLFRSLPFALAFRSHRFHFASAFFASASIRISCFCCVVADALHSRILFASIQISFRAASSAPMSSSVRVVVLLMLCLHPKLCSYSVRQVFNFCCPQNDFTVHQSIAFLCSWIPIFCSMISLALAPTPIFLLERCSGFHPHVEKYQMFLKDHTRVRAWLDPSPISK